MVSAQIPPPLQAAFIHPEALPQLGFYQPPLKGALFQSEAVSALDPNPGWGDQGLCRSHYSSFGPCKLHKLCPQTPSTGKPLNTSPTSSFQNLAFCLIDAAFLYWRLQFREWLIARAVPPCRQVTRNQAFVNQETWLRVGGTSRNIYPALKPQSWHHSLMADKPSASWAILGLNLIVYPSGLSGTVKYNSWRLEWIEWPSGSDTLVCKSIFTTQTLQWLDITRWRVALLWDTLQWLPC